MKMLEFPELRQRDEYRCGVKALQAVLAYYGTNVDEDVLTKIAGTNKTYGTPARGMETTIERYGLKFKSGKMTVKKVKDYIDQGFPVILLLQAWTKKKNVDWQKHFGDGHYAVAIGYDDSKIYFEDPKSVSRTYLSYEELETRWHSRDVGKRRLHNYGLVVYGKSHGFILQRFIHMD